MNETPGAEATHVPRQENSHDRSEELLSAALRYAEDQHWDVVPGTWTETGDGAGAQRCSCGDAACRAPGAHPARRDWQAAATSGPTTVRRMWAKHPRAAVLLPTGRAFDVVDVAEDAGCLALARLERERTEPGPVAATPDRRIHFFVLPGATAKVLEGLHALGYVSPAALDLGVRGEGGWVAAPPTRFGTSGSVQWVRRPTVSNTWLPDVADLISTLAYACGRERIAARRR
ncbi:bifunctional DNA primase/polymerase [Streptomyces sp. WMMC500]|uniref:bifunctional DNA primase/polymerase n=1 Tax=Streptomyces sp. WMMC500 TaxID=3015154 RepID=UPI00248AB077|nr:bifunctional DNA primase/polymerase [Streptomyces sp. WMMC500]WBB58637.1 bifunctional DNA primase/polymerase [Streptomyces sp. WMMC500]